MTLVVGGTFGIINELGIIPAALAAVLKKFHTRQELAVPFLILIFALFDSFMGCAGAVHDLPTHDPSADFESRI